jgi:hypothetical protein
MSREELKEIARQILDYRRNDHFQLMSSLSPKELAELTPLIREVSEEQIAKDRAEHEAIMKKEREEHEAFMKKEREFDRETKKFIAETDKFIAEYDKFLAETENKLSRRRNSPSIYFPFAMGEA